MIRIIDKKELEIYEKVCALHNYDFMAYNCEGANVKVCVIEVTYRKRKLTIDEAFYFGRAVQMELSEQVMNKVYDRIKEL